MPKDRFESIDFEKVSKLKAKNESSRKKTGSPRYLVNEGMHGQFSAIPWHRLLGTSRGAFE